MKKAYVQTRMITVALFIAFNVSCLMWRLTIAKIGLIPMEIWQNEIAGSVIVTVTTAALLLIFLVRTLNMKKRLLARESRATRVQQVSMAA